MMNRFFTLLLAASCLTAVGQYEVGDLGPAGDFFETNTIGAGCAVRCLKNAE